LGNLDIQVAGGSSLKVVGSSAICNAATTGAIRHSTVHNYIEFCTGVVWAPLAGNGDNAQLNVSCPTTKVSTGIANGQPVCTDLPTSTATTITQPALANAASIRNQHGTAGGPITDYFHIQANGQDVTDGLATMQRGMPYFGGENFVSTQMVPTGWQDNQANATTGYGASGTCENGDGYGNGLNAGMHCYTCINGNWSQNFFAPWQPAPPTPPSPGG
jgi:hypothetical protein